MNLKIVIFSLILAELATKCFVKGLQCYVCEDCNEYEDFKELHICGEIPNETLIKPGTSVSSVTKEPAKKPTSKPPAKPSIDDYLYEDSEEKHDEVNLQSSDRKKTTVTKATTRPTTKKLTSALENSLTESTTEKLTTKQTRTTPSIVTSSQQEITKVSSTESKTTSTTTPTVTTTKPKPVIVPDDNDYFEYEDPMKTDERSVKSLLKINEPVCYMIKYHANNTVFTNRGCTTFINANKYLTCQSLYNGAPMESCRVCSSNGCNKFLDDDGDEDNHGIFFNTAGPLKHFGILMLTLWVLLSREII